MYRAIAIERRKALAIVILSISIIVGISGVRIFPFSDYPMFAYVRTDLEAYTIMIKDQNGVEVLMGAHYFYPLYRLHIHQMISSTMQNPNLDFSWIKQFKKRAKLQLPNAVALTVRRVKFKKNENGTLDISDPLIVRRIHELAL